MRPLLLPLLLLLAAPAHAQSLASRIIAAGKTGGTVTITQNERGFTARLNVTKGRTLTIRATQEVTLSGEGVKDGVGLRILTGGRVVIEGPITWTRYARQPIFVTKAEGLSVTGGVILGCGAGLLTGRTNNVHLSGLRSEGNAGHGIYISEGGNGHRITGARCTRNAKCGIQINARPARSTGVEVRNCTLTGNGNAGLQFAAVTKGVVAGNDTTGSRQGCIFWDDGGGRKYRCERIDASAQPGRIVVAPNSVLVKVPAGAGRATVAAAGTAVRRPAR